MDLKALRRLIRENRRQNGYVVAECERVYFDVNAGRRRAISIDLSRTDLITEDDSPHEDREDTCSSYGGWESRYGN